MFFFLKEAAHFFYFANFLQIAQKKKKKNARTQVGVIHVLICCDESLFLV